MKPYFLILLTLILYVLQAPAQHCHYGGVVPDNPSHAMTSFTNNDEAETLIHRMVDLVGLKPNFEILPGNVGNAAAITRGGVRYIIYNGAFMADVQAATKTDWGAISILAHEVGHHLNGHTLDDQGSRPDTELEADEFSGFILQQMGASLSEALIAVRTLTSEEGSDTHPPRNERIAAVKKGWKKGEAKAGPTKTEVAAELPREAPDEIEPLLTGGPPAVPPPSMPEVAPPSELPPPAPRMVTVKVPCRHRVACQHRLPCKHRVACQHRAPCQHRTACRHRVACQHRVACRHRAPCQHRTACQHRIACRHVFMTAYGPRRAHAFDQAHAFDTAHPYDQAHAYDQAHPYDQQHAYDQAHPYDPAHSHHTQHPYDPAHPFDPEHDFDLETHIH